MSKTGPALFLMLLMMCSIFLSQSFSVKAQASKPLVRINPKQTGTLEIDDTFNVYVWVDNADGVEAAQVQITYDPTVLNVTRVVEGPFLASFGPTLTAQCYAEENLGKMPPTAEIYYSSALSPTSPNVLTGVSGSGILLNVTFRVVSESAAQIHLIPYKLAQIPGVGTVEEGAFFQNNQFINTIPDVQDGYYGTPVSLSARPEVINVGESTTLSGRVSGDAAASVSSVDIEYVKLGGVWTILVSVPTNGSGYFSYQWAGNETADYEFRVSFTLEGNKASSPIVVVTVEDVTSHIGYLYDALIVLIVIIVAAVTVYYIRRKRRPEELPPSA